jgi:hypothetical protein
MGDSQDVTDLFGHAAQPLAARARGVEVLPPQMRFGEHREEAVDRPDGDTGPIGDRETGFADPDGLVEFADRRVVGDESRVRRNHGMNVTC